MYNQRGQTLLIVVLIMVVVLTIALSVISRSIVTVRTSAEEEASQRAFAAAEAGIEQVLKTGIQILSPKSVGDQSAIENVSVTDVSGTQFLTKNGAVVTKDVGIDIWLAAHNTDDSIDFSTRWPTGSSAQTITIYWGESTDTCAANLSNTPALELILLTGTSINDVKAIRYAYDPCETRRSTGIAPVNNFAAPTSVTGGTVSGKTFAYYTTLTISGTDPNKGLLIRAIPLYASTVIGVSAQSALPIQGKYINSVGTSGRTTRKISYFEGYAMLPPELFQYVLFAQ